ncbi:MAG: DUF3997 domain-containing protein [Phycisphaerales bacterium]|nr:MAG: DUF3997 domain-containing protein [Phycisphaerales bacterium]
MSGKVCAATLATLLLVAIGGCCFVFEGLRYEDELTSGYVVRAADTTAWTVLERDRGFSHSAAIVRSMVFAYGWNRDFIIVKRHPRSEIIPDMSVTEWYIVEVDSEHVHGPMTELHFTQMREELGVPVALTFTREVKPDW